MPPILPPRIANKDQLLQLPDLPPHIRALTTDQSERLSMLGDSFPSKCITCRGEGTFKWYGEGRDPESIGDYYCKCDEQVLLYRFLRYAGVGRLYQRLGWEDLDPRYIEMSVVEEVMDYIESPGAIVSGMGFTLWGTKGGGKSMLSTLAIKSLIEKGENCYAIPFKELLDRLAEGWGNRDDRAWFARQVKNIDVLMIDDIGRERNKGTGTLGENEAESIVRHRVSQALPTIITTNENPEKLTETYGSHLASLLSEVNTSIEFHGLDARDDMGSRTKRENQQGLIRPVTL